MCADEEISSANCLHLATEADSSIFEHAIKVRKPYIITKQRERWTEEEHNKFLEALKLYGRAWRRIEEHLGSKTTVQIRSHAQKFFSKMTRELSSNSPSIVDAIEIPPPRPKRKPNHPYPRKLGHLSIKNGSRIDEPLWSSISKQSVSEQESKSPTSVLSAYRSDTVETTAADTLRPCVSPVSSVDKTVTVGEILFEQESGSNSSSTEYYCNHSIVPSVSLGMEDASPMELDSAIQNSFASEEASVAKQQITSLKLFGMTVIVADLQQQSLSNENKFKDQESFSDCNNIDLESQKLEEKDKSEVLGESRNECNFFSDEISPKASHENHLIPVETNMVSFPWCDLYGVTPFHVSRPMNPTSCQTLLDNKFVHIYPTSDESSQADSSTISDGNSEAAESAVQMKELTPAFALKHSKNSAFNSFRPSYANSTRGFVPYKR